MLSPLRYQRICPISTDVPQATNPAFTATPVIATLDPAIMESLLSAPVQVVQDANAVQIQARQFDPFTIIPDRPRNEVITYEAVLW